MLKLEPVNRLGWLIPCLVGLLTVLVVDMVAGLQPAQAISAHDYADSSGVYDHAANLVVDAVGPTGSGEAAPILVAQPSGTSPASAKERLAPEAILTTPQVSSTRLQNIVNNLYKGTTNPDRVGTGTTMDAVRFELSNPGAQVFGRSHIIKAEESLRGLQNWLKANPTAPYSERLIARSLADDLLDALGRSQ